jgi:hypothetical protein
VSAKKTATVWALAAILFGYWWIFERVPAGPKTAEIARGKFLAIYRDEVAAVELSREGRDVRAEKRDKRWILTRP